MSHINVLISLLISTVHSVVYLINVRNKIWSSRMVCMGPEEGGLNFWPPGPEQWLDNVVMQTYELEIQSLTVNTQRYTFYAWTALRQYKLERSWLSISPGIHPENSLLEPLSLNQMSTPALLWKMIVWSIVIHHVKFRGRHFFCFLRNNSTQRNLVHGIRYKHNQARSTTWFSNIFDMMHVKPYLHVQYTLTLEKLLHLP